MTAQPTRDQLRIAAESALACGTFDGEVTGAVAPLLDQLDQAEARIEAVRDVLDAEEARPRAIGGGHDRRTTVRIADIRRALDGEG